LEKPRIDTFKLREKKSLLVKKRPTGVAAVPAAGIQNSDHACLYKGTTEKMKINLHTVDACPKEPQRTQRAQRFFSPA
jgi:hypothetical protein